MAFSGMFVPADCAVVSRSTALAETATVSDTVPTDSFNARAGTSPTRS